jgi:hypothetical protein
MVGGEVALEIRPLHRHGKGIREIARATGSSRNTVRRYLRDESTARYKARPARATKLDLFKDYVVERPRTVSQGSPRPRTPGQISIGVVHGTRPISGASDRVSRTVWASRCPVATRLAAAIGSPIRSAARRSRSSDHVRRHC